MDVTGTYADTATFLYSLTRFPKIISVTAVQMHPSGSTGKANPHAAPTVTTNLKLVAFMFHDGRGRHASTGAATAQATPSVAACLRRVVPPRCRPPRSARSPGRRARRSRGGRGDESGE